MKYQELIERLRVEVGDGNAIFCEVLMEVMPGWETPGAAQLRDLWAAGGRIDAALALYAYALPGWSAYELSFDKQLGRCMAYVEEDLEAPRFHGYYFKSRKETEIDRRQASHPCFALLMAILRAVDAERAKPKSDKPKE